MGSNKKVTLVDTPDFKVQAILDIMGMASGDSNKFQRYSTISYLREDISWKLAVSSKAIGDRSKKRKRTKANAPKRVINCKEQRWRKPLTLPWSIKMETSPCRPLTEAALPNLEQLTIEGAGEAIPSSRRRWR